MWRQSDHKRDNSCVLARLSEDVDGSGGVDNSFRCKALIRCDLSVLSSSFIFQTRRSDCVKWVIITQSWESLTYRANVMRLSPVQLCWWEEWFDTDGPQSTALFDYRGKLPLAGFRWSCELIVFVISDFPVLLFRYILEDLFLLSVDDLMLSLIITEYFCDRCYRANHIPLNVKKPKLDPGNVTWSFSLKVLKE